MAIVTVQELFASEGQDVSAPSSRPVVLSDPGVVFRAEGGPVDVFHVPMAGGEPTGTRTFVGRLAPEALVLSGAGDEGGSDTLVAVSSSEGGKLRRLPLARLLGKGDREELVPLVDAWIAFLKGGLVAGRRPSGTAAPAPSLPELESPGAAELLAADRSLGNLAAFQRAVVARLGVQRAEAVAEEQQRIRLRARSHRSAFLGVGARIVRLLERTARPPLSAGGGGDALFTALTLVGRASGIPIRVPPPAASLGVDPLRAIARASRVRHRRVVLAERWWTTDSGPLLGSMKEDGRPVALLPLSAKRYELVDPLGEVRRPVDGELAAQLNPEGHMLYRSLPVTPVDVPGLLRFGSRGLHKDFVFVGLTSAAVGALATLPALATRFLFDALIPRGQRTQLLAVIAVLLVAALASGLFQLARALSTLRIEGKMDAAVQAAVWDRLLAVPLSFHRRFTSGDLAVRALSINSIRMMLTGATTTSLLGVVLAAFNLAVLFSYSTELALWAVLVVGLGVAVAGLIAYSQLGYQRAAQGMRQRVMGRALQLMTGIAKLRVAGAEPAAFSLWATDFVKQRSLDMAARTRTNALAAFNTVLPAIGSLVIYWRIGALSETVSMPGGLVVAFLAAFGTFLGASTALTATVMGMLSVIPLYESAKPILQALPEVDETKASPGQLTGEIEVQSLKFRYEPEGALILRGISFRVERNEFAALVGPSGAGKSTLFRILLGLDHPESGTVLYDGQDLLGLDVLGVRQQIGTVLQTGKLVPGDILTNIVGAASACTIDDAWEAAKMVGLDGDIERMAMGMSTYVSEGMGTFSGGQRQRLLIARALVNRPRILLMDEATSALDDATQAIVSASLERLNVTRIVIAHRLSTIRKADRLHFIKDGLVTESGSYDELMAKKGDFYSLAARQIV